jgi:lysophospholipase L1-like esterase
VTFYEIVDGAKTELGKATTLVPKEGNGIASIPAVPWRCDRIVRQFTATALTRDGRTIEASNTARTPDCRTRMSIVAPARVEPGEPVEVTLKDRWQLGDLRMRLCITRPKTPRACKVVVLAPGEKSATVTRNAGPKTGLIDLDLVVAKAHQHQRVGVGMAVPKEKAGGKLPVALVTGDSMMEGIDSILAQQLKARYRVNGQTRPGTGVSKELGKPWTTVAREQASKLKPALTIVMLGGNDGYAMKTPSGVKVECCDEPWRVEYLSRITAMATAYLRDGRGTVVWALLPPPRRSDLVAQMNAVNDVIRRMATALPAVQLVHLDEIFGPEYRDVVNGQHVRDPDGLHLSLPGQRIAAKAIVAAVRAAAAAAPTSTTPGGTR